MFLTIITFVIVLGFLVFVHELGHFITARKTGTKAEEFGMGLPPRIFGLRRRADNPKKWEWVGPKTKAEETKHTIYSLNWLPIGGFLKIKGENDDEIGSDSFSVKSAGQRSLMLGAGVIMNFIFAAVILSIAFMVGFPSVLDNEVDLAKVKNRQVQIASILPDSPADQAAIQAGDIILGLDELVPEEIDQVQSFVSSHENQPISVQLRRGREVVSVSVTPEYIEETEKPALGVGLLEIGTVRYPIHEAIWRGVSGTVTVTIEIFKVIGRLIGTAFAGGEVEEQIAGPVGIAVLTGQFIDLGLVYVLQFAALLSINLAIINILPFPALDGGRILFIVIEKLRGRPVSKKIESIVHTTGFALLILLIIFVTYKDISQFGDQILGAVRGIF
jgi:regulator of sigma E protease